MKRIEDKTMKGVEREREMTERSKRKGMEHKRRNRGIGGRLDTEREFRKYKENY